MRKRILTAEDLGVSVESGVLIVDSPAGQTDLPQGSLGVMKLLLESSDLCKQGCEAQFVCRTDRIRRRVVLVTMPLAKVYKVDIASKQLAKSLGEELVGKALDLHQRDIDRLQAMPVTKPVNKRRGRRDRTKVLVHAPARAA